jgi:c-di-GMP-binding flagellar brake protein YcgR
MPSLTKCMMQLTSDIEANPENNTEKNQRIISKLFDYRTKLQNESDSKKGLTSTLALDTKQQLRIVFPGHGVFTSKLLNNGHELIIEVPRQKDMITIPADQWVGSVISVYLWRKGDARYVFDTLVLKNGIFLGQTALFLKHSYNLVRTQKRKSVRAQCQIDALLYIIKEKVIDYSIIETQNGYKCVLEDISEAGALIRIGGKGVQNVQIKIQFTINNMLVVMFGIVRTVEFNQETNQSLLHFECIHIEQEMRNEILRYVYKMLPEHEKEVLQALDMTDEDKQNDETVIEKEENVEELPKMIDNIDATSVSKVPVADSEIIDDTISIF